MTAKKKSELFASVDTLAAAREVAQQGTLAAILVAVLTAVLAGVAIASSGASGEEVSQSNAASFWDAGIFVAVAWGIYRMSRVAAVAGLLLYGAGQIFMRIDDPSDAASGLFVASWLVWLFINGVRGTFAYHRLRQRDRLSE